MSNPHRYCVIMCGGIGSRLRPYSRADRPKQFIDFFGTGRSLLRMSYDRILPLVDKEHVIIVTNDHYAPLVREQLPELADHPRYSSNPPAATQHPASPGRPTTSTRSTPRRR